MPETITISVQPTALVPVIVPDLQEAITVDPPDQIMVNVSAPGDGSSGGAVDIRGEIPGGAINGINTVFTTAYAYVSGSEDVYLNGIRQRLNVDYTQTGATELTMIQAPGSGEEISVNYSKLYP